MSLSACLRPNEAPGDRILKVNHAGEHGAVNIYAGQLFVARLTARSMCSELAEFQAHERRHRAIFAAELERRGLHRCRSYLLCGVGGLVLGALTGILGRRAIAATTVAVERVVLRHLDLQMAVLQTTDQAAATAIGSIVREERDHHDRSAAHACASPLWLTVLSPIVARLTEAVIWLGMHL